MTQYCYFHTLVTNSILKWNCNVGAVAAVRIHFGKEKLLTLHKSSVSVHCLTLLLLGGNGFRCSG